ncbi:hypothetical protein H072_1101 [Dactylellina haptotyla CBS 200.50]|uniref:SAP domain-containing protein n=1 Tax=Dactylellina haptotyla (strain CBS 200.50) TaxID=1284197 RepID=S8AVC6_DACHA|nr:hypothetical protein H072_1101 [Dactylellina haptotyla CBS 200.50]
MHSRLMSLRNIELKEILQRCGWPTSGTKYEMVEKVKSQLLLPRLATLRYSGPGILRETKRASGEHRILSLDMGIKNLALCLLKVSSGDLESDIMVHPKILAWQKFSLTDIAHDISLNRKSKDILYPEVIQLSDVDFAAASLAPLATFFARQLVTIHKPTMIAIEKQRYRTMGSAAVQEWTIKVNKLEAMLHAALRVMQEEGFWKYGSTCSVCPQRMTNFWLNQNRLLPKSRAGKITKSLKIQLVRGWLKDGQAVTFNGNDEGISKIVSDFTETTKRNKSNTSDKLDDLADCLLQGLGLIEWERNRLRLVKEYKIQM